MADEITSEKAQEVYSVTVPTIKAVIPAALAEALYNEGYRKARAVVVYPSPQDRKVICQGIANPTLFTENHRGTYTASSGDPLGDLYAQASWFFRPKLYNYKPYADANSPFSEPNCLPYQEKDDNTDNIKWAEIQGVFYQHNQFRVDWKTLTLNSPDIEFDPSLHNLDFTSESIKYSIVGNAEFIRTLSDIDIQTETPAISAKGSGFEKKSFKRKKSRGIISGLFWDDYAVDENRKDSESEWFFEAFSDQGASAKWMVYLWNRKGSLNNDINRPTNNGVRSAVLKQKIISNLRYANTDYSEGITRPYKSQLFDSDVASMIKLPDVDPNCSNLYKGNVDTLLPPDDSDGMYFALHYVYEPNPYVLPGAKVDGKGTFTSPEFTDDILYKTYGIYDSGGVLTDWGIYNYSGGKWTYDDSPFGRHTGDGYADLVLQKEGVRMQYKSTPHLVMVQSAESGSVYSNLPDESLPVFEVQRTIEDEQNVIFGGISEDALKENVWIPCGEPVALWDDSSSSSSPSFINDKTVEYSWGDTYFQRWDCLKTYAYTPDDINQVVEIGSFMLESYINIDGRYDRNRGQLNNLYMSPRNFNLLNPVYSQINNFFSYRKLDEDAYKRKHYPNQITWSKTKTSGADVDLWTNVTLASVMEVDGDKGPVNKLVRFNDQLLSFQDRGISRILYNENVQISTQQGVPIELANSGKVQGKQYLSDSIGCVNKWSICSTPSGIYFIDSVDRNIYMFNGQLNNLSGTLGMNSWAKKEIPPTVIKWTPYKYVEDDVESDFLNFVSYNDRQNQDVLFINDKTALAYSEKLGVFTSFYSYGKSPYFCNFVDGGIWIKNEEDEEGYPCMTLHGHHQGNYCSFFGENRPYWMTLVGNPEPQLDKIFTNLEFRACVEGDGELDSETGKFTPTLPFDALETWNEYQRGVAYLSHRNGHSAMLHHTRDNGASLKRKFRIWRCDIPRDNGKVLNVWDTSFDEKFRNPERRRYPNDRMRNPWLYLRLLKNAAEDDSVLEKTEIHDVLMTYFV